MTIGSSAADAQLRRDVAANNDRELEAYFMLTSVEVILQLTEEKWETSDWPTIRQRRDGGGGGNKC